MKEENYSNQVEVYVNEAYAETYIKQIYENTYENPIELTVDLPNKNGVQFADFEVEINDKKVKSKLIKKEKAEEKYSDAISSGNTGIYSEYDKKFDKYIIHLGNIEPSTKVYFTSHFLQSIISNDLNYLYRVIDQFPLPKNNNSLFSPISEHKIKIYFQTSSPITILEQKTQGSDFTIKNRFQEDRTKHEIELIGKSTISYSNGNSLFDLAKEQNNKFPELSFIFQTQDYKKPKLYKQYDPKNNETTYLLSYFKTINDENNYNNDKVIKSYPGLYYFVIDQSGSMSGYPMSLVIKTLKVFMQSLSIGSYYQLIGFGTVFKSYSVEPLSYTKENVKKTIEDIENLKGNMGGTNLYNPLEFIYNNYKKNEELNLPQHIFILTDGYTLFRERALNIIEKNNSKYQVYAYGIGNDFDKDFIRTVGDCGFGSYKFINDIRNLNTVINEQLSKCMRVYYDKVKFTVENNDNEIIYDFYRNDFMLENQLVNYSFIMKGKVNGNIQIKSNYEYGKEEKNEIFKFDENQIINIKDGDILAKIIIHNLIQKGEGEDFSEEEKITKNAKKYQILCQYTSLYAEVENTQTIQEGNLQTIQIKSDNNLPYNQDKYSTGISYNPFANNHNPGRSLFINNNTNSSHSGLFENNNSVRIFCNNNNKTTEGLFGNSNNNNPMNNNIIHGSLFENNNNSRSGGLFGNNNNTNSGGLFGNNNNTNSEGLFGNNNNSLFRNNKITNTTVNIAEENNINNNILDKEKVDDVNHSNILENIIMSLDIFEGCWEENQFTKYILDMKSNIYDQVIKIVGNNKVAVTFMVLFYILNDKKEKIPEYSNIINKAKTYLVNNNFTYEFIISKISIH